MGTQTDGKEFVMNEPNEKYKRAKRRGDTRRKNQRDELPRLHRDTKEVTKNNKNKVNYDAQNDDGEVS